MDLLALIIKMNSTGLTLSIEAPDIFHLINEYDHE